MADDSDEDSVEVGVVITPEEMLVQGLLLAGVSQRSIDRCKDSTNDEKFLLRYGSNQVVLCQIWEDLQTTTIEAARAPPKQLVLKYFLMANHFLRHYGVESERALAYGLHRDTCRDWSWHYVEKIAALKGQKIIWPDDEFGEDLWILTVDGTHCWIHEPDHPLFSMDDKFYSHKYNKSGVNYELAVSISTSRLIWMNGPFKAGESDMKVFRERGLRDKMRQLGRKGIADGGYHAAEDFDVLSFPNADDDPLVKKFKRRAQRRQEVFNNKTKVFHCLKHMFWHSCNRFADCFEAVCVICQCQMENGSPLFNVLVDGMLQEQE